MKNLILILIFAIIQLTIVNGAESGYSYDVPECSSGYKYPSPDSKHDQNDVCSFRPPNCTASDDLRRAIFRGYLLMDSFSPGVVTVFKKNKGLSRQDIIGQLYEAPGHIPCLVDEAAKYFDGDCSEIGQVRGCLWETIRSIEWSKRLPLKFRNLLDSVTEKDYIVPSDQFLDKMSTYVGEKFLPKCMFEMFQDLRYCL